MKINNFKNIFIVEFLLLIFLKLLLDFKYVNFVFKYYNYSGFTYNFDIFTYLIGWLIYIFLFIILDKKRNLYIYEFYFFIYLLWCLPNIIIYTFHSHNFIFLLYLLLPYVIIVSFTFNKPTIKSFNFTYGNFLILSISFFILLLVLLHYMIITRNSLVLNFYNVYEHRLNFEKYSSTGIFGYINSWSFKIFSTILLAWSIKGKKKIYFIFFIILTFLLFAFSGHKSALISIFLVPFFYILFRFKNISLIIVQSIIFLLLFTIIGGYILNSILPESLIIRRLFFIPAFLNYTYLDFFSHNQLIYWSNSFLKFFIEYPYDLPLTKLIGKYLGSPLMAANTGFIASGYAHAKYFGILLYTIIVTLIMNIINILAQKKEKYFVYSIVFIPLTTLFISSDLITTLFTHGLMISIIVLFFYKSKVTILKVFKYRFSL